jgi:hypothetical protein
MWRENQGDKRGGDNQSLGLDWRPALLRITAAPSINATENYC